MEAVSWRKVMVTLPATLIDTSSFGPGTMPVLQLLPTSQNPPVGFSQVIVGVNAGATEPWAAVADGTAEEDATVVKRESTLTVGKYNSGSGESVGVAGE